MIGCLLAPFRALFSVVLAPLFAAGPGLYARRGLRGVDRDYRRGPGAVRRFQCAFRPQPVRRLAAQPPGDFRQYRRDVPGGIHPVMGAVDGIAALPHLAVNPPVGIGIILIAGGVRPIGRRAKRCRITSSGAVNSTISSGAPASAATSYKGCRARAVRFVASKTTA